MRFHNLKYIEKVADTIGSLTHNQSYGAESTNDGSTTKYSISDLYEFVKAFDKDFTPAPEVSEYVLNADGTPKVFYHGTNADFTEFDRKKIGTNTDDGIYGRGFYFSSHKHQSEQYGKLMSCYLSLRNPLVLTDYSSIEELAGVLDMSESCFSVYDGVIRPRYSFVSQFSSHVTGAGFDGVIVDYGTSDEIVVFDPTKIKSETDNIGTFDKGNSDIRFSRETGESSKPFDEAVRRADAVRGWNYYKINYVVPISDTDVRAYSGEIQIKLIGRGDCFYDITKIRDITHGSAGQAFIKAAGSAYNTSTNSISQNTDLSTENAEKNSGSEGKASRELDFEYLSAVESGDIETAQRMVDEASLELSEYQEETVIMISQK